MIEKLNQNQIEEFNLEKESSNLKNTLISLSYVLINPSNFEEDALAKTASFIHEITSKIDTIPKETKDKIFEDTKSRIEVIEHINTVFREFANLNKDRNFFKTSTSLDLSHSMSQYIMPILTFAQNDLYTFPDRYDINKIDFKTNKIGKLNASSNLFDLFIIIENYKTGMSNYLDLAERAFMCEGLDSGQFFREYGSGIQSVHLFSKLYTDGSMEFKNKLNEYLDFLTANPKGISYVTEEILKAGRGTKIEERIFHNLNESFKKNFNIEDEDFAQSLNYKEGTLVKTFREMSLIENEYPGACALLNKKYNICEFSRYPSYILSNQLQEENEQKPYGLIIFPRSDHNGAFAGMGDKITNIHFETRGKHLLRIFEASSKMDIARILLECNKKYGAQNKISYLVLGGHGQLDSLDLGSYMNSNINHTENKYIHKDDFDGEGIKKINELFVEKPAITLISCETGGDNGLIDSISKTYNAEVVAPRISTSVKDIHVKYDKENKPHFEVTWENKDANSLYVSGEKIN